LHHLSAKPSPIPPVPPAIPIFIESSLCNLDINVHRLLVWARNTLKWSVPVAVPLIYYNCCGWAGPIFLIIFISFFVDKF
jgi:hypothetical protein